MEKECNIVRDLMPLVAEGLATADSASFVESHVDRCPACRQEFRQLQQPVEAPLAPELAPMKHLKKKLQQQKARTVLLTAVLVLVVAVAVFSWLTAPQYFPYTPDLLTITDQADGQLSIQFSPEVTGYRLQQIPGESPQDVVYLLEAWTSLWDQWFQLRDPIQGSLQEQRPFALYYAQNQQTGGSHLEDILLYHNTATSPAGVMTLPRLTLWYWLLLSVIAFVVLLGLWLVFRKRGTLGRWLWRLLWVPVSYGVGYVCVTGFDSATWSPQRDFSLIVLIGLLTYGAIWLFERWHEERNSQKENP